MEKRHIFSNFGGSILSSPSTLFYLSGLSNQDAMIFAGKDGMHYITDRRYEEVTYTNLKDMEIDIVNQGESYLDRAIRLAKDRGLLQVAIEEDHLVAKDYLTVSRQFERVDFVSTAIKNARRRKANDEVAKIAAAQAITDKVYEEFLAFVKAGVTEIDCANFVKNRFFSYGAVEAFDTIVAFSENASLPHAVPSLRPLKIGDSILIDFGAKLDGYCSDMTRTFCYKKCTDEFRQLYDVVLNAQLRAIDAIDVGVCANDVDKVARDYFGSLGYDARFKHSLGHGVGIDIHEVPYMSSSSCDVLDVGDVVTVEPGLYFDGKMGIRIEDMIILREIGVENLTNSSKELIII